jgi:hypothetical protein
MKPFIIRASSLNRHSDCQRAWAAENIQPLKEKCLLERKAANNNKTQFIGAVYGSACHLGSELMLDDKRHGRRVDWQRAVKQSIISLREELVGSSVKFDPTTTSLKLAEKQLEQALAELADKYIIPKSSPLLIETQLKMKWPGRIGDQDVEIHGKPDCVEETLNIIDTKFGVHKTNFRPQAGAYLWLVNARYPELNVGDFQILFIQRTGKDRRGNLKPQIGLDTITYNRDACIDVAEKQFEECVRSTNNYLKTGNLWAFNTNANSKFCTNKTCIAFGTSVCDQWIQNSEKENEVWEEI